MILAQGVTTSTVYLPFSHPLSYTNMAPMKAMKAMKAGAKAMSKGAIAEALATGCELKKSVCAKVLDVLAEVATQGVKKSGVFSIPGLARLKIRNKPATKAGKREVFGKVVMVKAKPARKIVKAYPVAALKQSI